MEARVCCLVCEPTTVSCDDAVEVELAAGSHAIVTRGRRLVAPVVGWVDEEAFGNFAVLTPRLFVREECCLALALSAPSPQSATAYLAASLDEGIVWACAEGDEVALPLLLAARADSLLVTRPPEALADALRAMTLFGGDCADARSCAARIGRTVAAALAAYEAFRQPGPGLALAAAYAELAAGWEPSAPEAALDRNRAEILRRCSLKASPKLQWRRQRCTPETTAEARLLASGGEPRLMLLGLGCGRCGTSSLAELLRWAGCDVTHESTLPDCRVTLWDPAEPPADYARRRRDQWRRKGDVVGDVNYAHLPFARCHLDAASNVRIVGLRRDRSETVRSYFRWTEPGGASGTLKSRDHWRPHDGTELQFDEWDLTFPKCDANSKEEAIGQYYDAYYAELTELLATYGPDRVRIFESPKLFHDEKLQRDLFNFLELPKATPNLGFHLNRQQQ